ncbi:MAG: hypothetical protein LKG25_08695 [Prevotella sp.]|nr:hypothetical protein [Prevotella sp.]MCI1282653.1 hypothetical protein [Prevotella sp.]
MDDFEDEIGRHIKAQKVWKKVISGKRPSDETLDRLALLAGFQNWKDLKEALHGEGDASLNYDDETMETKK